MTEIARLLTIMAKLRDPNGGCPWDVEQNFATIAPYTLEEAYEVADAIERNDMAALKEELGDLLLQVVFHSQMAKEEGLFDFEEVAKTINEKMVRRHPHVFSKDVILNLFQDPSGNLAPKDEWMLKQVQHDKIENAEAQVTNWENIKKQEKEQKGHASIMDDVPNNFPALLRAQKLGKAAAKKRFDWPTLEPVFDKVEEEIGELKEAITDNQNIEEELGDLLFAVVNIARHVKVDAETALRRANQKFEKRFRIIEPEITEESSLEEMEAAWAEAKKAI